MPKLTASKSLDHKDPSLSSSIRNNESTGKMMGSCSQHDLQRQDQQEQRVRRMGRRGSLQHRIKSVLPARRISVPKENDKDPGAPETRPSLTKACGSKSSIMSGNVSQSKREKSPHRRFFRVMRRMGSKDKETIDGGGGGYSSSDDEDPAFVSSEEIPAEQSKPKAQEAEEVRPSLKQEHPKIDGNFKTSQQEQHHEIPRKTKAHVVDQGNTTGWAHEDRISSSWEKSLVL